VLVWFRITLTTFHAKITTVSDIFMFIKVMSKTLLVTFFGHCIVLMIPVPLALVLALKLFCCLKKNFDLSFRLRPEKLSICLALSNNEIHSFVKTSSFYYSTVLYNFLQLSSSAAENSVSSSVSSSSAKAYAPTSAGQYSLILIVLQIVHIIVAIADAVLKLCQ